MKRPFSFLASCAFAAAVTGSAIAAPTVVAQTTPAPAAGAAEPALAPASAGSCGDFLTPVAAPAGAPAQWLAFMTAVSAINDYTLTLHEVDSTDPPKVVSEDRQLKLAYAKPCYGSVSVLSGRLQGSAAVWHGGHKLRGHLGGSMSHLKAIIPDTDIRGTDIRGLPMYAAYFPWIINRFNEQGPGSLSYAPGTPVNGVPTDVITVIQKTPTATYGLTKDVIVLSSTTHLPISNDGYVGDKVVLHAEFNDIVVNPGLPITAFDLQ